MTEIEKDFYLYCTGLHVFISRGLYTYKYLVKTISCPV